MREFKNIRDVEVEEEEEEVETNEKEILFENSRGATESRKS